VVEKALAIVEKIFRAGPTIDSATCIDNYIRDDSLNEALILLISHTSDLESFSVSILACASMPTFD